MLVPLHVHVHVHVPVHVSVPVHVPVFFCAEREHVMHIGSNARFPVLRMISCCEHASSDLGSNLWV